MKLSLQRADEFNADFDQQYRWYLEQAGEELAQRFLCAVAWRIRCHCWLNGRIWVAAESFIIRYCKTFVHFKWSDHFNKFSFSIA